MKKLFGQINLTWKRLILFALAAGIYTALMAILPTGESSFGDIATTFEVWILFGIFLIMNSRSALDSGLKCFVFFLISQPLVYLIQDAIYHGGLFGLYYRNWVLWTILTFPMGFVGYYIKKNKWWGLVILTPVLLFDGLTYYSYARETLSFFPNHLLTTLFCFVTILLYPLVMFEKKQLQRAGVCISAVILLSTTLLLFIGGSSSYQTQVLYSDSANGIVFDDTYEVSLADERYGTVSISYMESIEDYAVDADFVKTGETQLILTSPEGEEMVFQLSIERDSFEIEGPIE